MQEIVIYAHEVCVEKQISMIYILVKFSNSLEVIHVCVNITISLRRIRTFQEKSDKHDVQSLIEYDQS